MNITFLVGHLCKERHALLNELALDLGKYGATVTVITGYPSRRISEATRRYYIDHPIEKISDTVVVKRVGTKSGEGKGLLVRMIKYFFLSRKIYKEAKKTPTDVFYIYSTPFFLGYEGTKLSKIAPTVYNAQDLFPDSLMHIKGLKETNPLIKFFRTKEKSVYQKCNHIITISGEMKKTIITNGGSPDKISVVFNWADVNNLHHVDRDKNTLFDEFKLKRDDFIVSYAGDLGMFQGWDLILDAAKKIKELNANIKFVLIGNGSYKENIEKRIMQEEISNVVLFPLQSASRLSEVYSLGDIELLPIEKGITKIALPSKTGAITASGSPILAIVDHDSEIDKMIIANKLGFTVEPGCLEDLVDKILLSYKNRLSLKSLGENSRHYAEKMFSRSIQTKKYFEIIKGACDGK